MTSVAERMRRYRTRLRRGAVIVSVEVDPRVLEALIRSNHLTPDEALDRSKSLF